MKFTAVLFLFFGLAIASPLIQERKVVETESNSLSVERAFLIDSIITDECTGDSVDVPESGQKTGGCSEDF